MPFCLTRKSVGFFGLPRKPEIRQTWFEKLQLDPKINNHKICTLHFDESDLGKGHTTTKLFKDAIPSKNLPQEESKRKLDVEIKVKIEENIVQLVPKDQTKVEENKPKNRKDLRHQCQYKKQSYFCQKDALSETIEIKDELIESVDIQEIEEEQEEILGF